MRSVDAFGSRFAFEYDTAALDALGRLDEGKSVRIVAKTVSTFTQPQTKQVVRHEAAVASVLTVEKHQTIEVPAGRIETIVLPLEGENAPDTPPATASTAATGTRPRSPGMSATGWS